MKVYYTDLDFIIWADEQIFKIELIESIKNFPEMYEQLYAEYYLLNN